MQKNIALETFNQLNLFSEEIKNMYIIHIPHSSIYIPSFDSYINDGWKIDIEKTDWRVAEIFDIPNIDKVIVPFSRVWCDVERLEDELEPKFKNGHGFYYTHNELGEKYRDLSAKNLVYNEYYLKHHKDFSNKVKSKIDKYNSSIIIDCHTFSDTNSNYPDICIGTNNHTPQFLLNEFKLAFESMEYSIEINNPYSGTFVPLDLYNKEKRVYSIMIEINKRLYMNSSEKVNEINKQLISIFEEN